MHQKSASEKPNLFNVPILMQKFLNCATQGLDASHTTARIVLIRGTMTETSLDIRNRIGQKRVDALSARILHEYALTKLRVFTTLIDLLALIVPVGYMTVRYLAKGTLYETVAEIIWECIAALLLILVITKLVLCWGDKIQQHAKLVGQNISLATQENYLLSKLPLDTDAAQPFFLYSDVIEIGDRESLGTPRLKRKQRAYREALKELGHDVRCPLCRASPWHYKRGSCQACGNTPAVVNERSSNAEAC
jgi:mobilome CxxCx(11)CxxC protein